MKTFEEDEMIQEYIYALCESKNIPIDLRFHCVADMNKFWSNKTNSYFEIDCVNYYASNIEDIKILISHIVDVLWEQAAQPNHKIALYIEDIVDMNGWFDVCIGGCLFEDDALA